MAKTREIFVCRACGSAQQRWMGKCPDCGAWDSLDAERVGGELKKDPQRGLVEAWGEITDAKGGRGGVITPGQTALPIRDIAEAEATPRLPTGLAEFDRVLGGPRDAGPDPTRGIVPGSAVLVGGAPGIGKSTLLLQAALSLAARGTRVLYVSSEESAHQIRLRAQRLAPQGELPAELLVLADTNLARIVEQTRRAMPAVLVIDSIQMVYKPDLPAAPGSVPQLRRCCAELTYLAKMSGIAVLMVGHVTKEGTLAGPRLLEHLVDAVLAFEGDRYHAHRLVRGVKNRFGATDEIGIFEMTGGGLREVPSGAGVAAASGAAAEPRPGSVVCPVLTGSRCVLVEVQALTATGFLGAAKRKSSGLDANRLAMLIAVLEQHAELRLADRDIFASAVGGVRVAEPAADLALLLAVAGAHLRRAVSPATAAVGEVGLGGEVRPVTQLEPRAKEAARLGYTRLLVPEMGRSLPRVPGLELVPVRTVARALEQLG